MAISVGRADRLVIARRLRLRCVFALDFEMVVSTDTYVPRSRDVASEDFDGEFVVLDLASGKYFSLLGGAAIVWRGLMAGH